ncbi:hypothetical protein T484DRAFT_1814729 [Baffinella frigidus]|nr:hypothetical protein T484DRAFT_1814729 [Cryptophyta sp. CCMP2293]
MASEMSQWQPTSPRGALRRPPSRPDSPAEEAGVYYITENLIVIDHPQPAGQTGASAAVGFILRKHASFRVYNLSPRCVYSARVWENRAEKLCSIPVEDKRPVVLSTVLAFCEDVRQWLASGHPTAVELLASAALLSIGAASNAGQARAPPTHHQPSAAARYAQARHPDRRPTLPSGHLRYLGYVEVALRSGAPVQAPPAPPLDLQLVTARNLSGLAPPALSLDLQLAPLDLQLVTARNLAGLVAGGVRDPFIRILHSGGAACSATLSDASEGQSGGTARFSFPGVLRIVGDVRVEVVDGGGGVVLYAPFHTSFCQV